MSGPQIAVDVHDLRRKHLEQVVRIDALYTGERKPRYWERVFDEFPAHGAENRVGLAAEVDGRMIGYLVGDVRAFEFGSEVCGWVLAIGVDPSRSRTGVASALLEHACQRFRKAGVMRVRTMVRRNDVSVLSFFRANGFTGGSFVQLESDLEARA